MAQDVFISYATEDIITGSQICDSLESNGITCWLAERNILKGVNYPRAIIKAIKECSVFVVIYSKSALKSEHVISELCCAFNQKKPIIAFRIEDCEPNEDFEYMLSTKSWIDAFKGNREQHIETLINNTRTLLANKTESDYYSGMAQDEQFSSIFQGLKIHRSWTIYISAALIILLSYLGYRERLMEFREEFPLLPSLIFLVPLLMIFPELISQKVKQRRKLKLINEGKLGKLKDPEYFRTYPYEHIPNYLKEFRSDMAHKKILEWVRTVDFPILFLSGQSGTGKTSILQAYVVPGLKKLDSPITSVLIRTFGDPLTNLQKTLIKEGYLDETDCSEDRDLHSLLKKVIVRTPANQLLIVFDQFEELLITGERDPLRITAMQDFLTSIIENPINGLKILLSFRTDYLTLLQNMNLPDLMTRKNWYEIGAFTETGAKNFLMGSNLNIPRKIQDKLFDQIAAFEGAKGIVRPIILNMVGMIISKSDYTKGDASKKQTENLLIEYLKYHIFLREMKDHAPRILKEMITDVGTKMPRTLDELSSLTNFQLPEVKGTLTLLANAGIVRLVDDKDQIWEVSHDFIAHYLMMVLNNQRQSVLALISTYIIPVGLLLWSFVLIGFTPKYADNLWWTNTYKIVSQANGTISNNSDGSFNADFQKIRSRTPHFGRREMFKVHSDLKNAIKRLADLEGISYVNLDDCRVVDAHLMYFKEFKDLKTLYLGENDITDMGLKHFENADQITSLYLNDNHITGKGFEYLSRMENLKTLDLSNNNIGQNLSHLNGMKLSSLNLSYNNITDEELSKIEHLEVATLHLEGNKITNLGITRLLENITKREHGYQSIYIGENNVTEERLDELEEIYPRISISNCFEDE